MRSSGAIASFVAAMTRWQWFPALLWGLLALQALVLLVFTAPWIRGDSGEYLQLASALADGLYGGVTAAGFEPEALRPPAYPAFLALTLELASLPRAIVVGLQLGLYLLCLYLVDRRLKAQPLARLLFLAMALVYVAPAIYVSSLMPEVFATLAVTGAVLLLGGEPDTRRLLLIGAVAGAGALFRADLILLPVAISGVLLLQALFRHRFRRLTWRPLLPLLSAAVVLLPYMLYNQASFGRFTPLPVASATGNSLFMSTWQDRLSQDDLNAFYRKEATPAAVEAGLAGEVAAINRALGVHPYTAPWHPKQYPDLAREIASSAAFAEAAAARITADPLTYGRHVVSNGLWKLWTTEVYPAGVPGFAQVLLTASAVAIAWLGLAAALLILLRPGGWLLGRAQVLLFAYVPLLHVWFHGEARYTTAVRPILLMLAASPLPRSCKGCL